MMLHVNGPEDEVEEGWFGVWRRKIIVCLLSRGERFGIHRFFGSTAHIGLLPKSEWE